MRLAERIEKNLKEYLHTITSTGTVLEKNNELFFKNWFQSVPYLKKHPEHCGFYGVRNDSLERKVAWALLKGNGDKTVVAIHHTDTAGIEDFGIFSEYAYEPEVLEKQFLKADVSFNEDVKEDLNSGNWMFGRGASDMKSGGSIELSLFEQYSEKETFEGNLLLLAVPDEENLSAGMRSAAFLLKELKERLSLDYVLMLNAEPHERTDGNQITLYDGSVGKIMPIVLVRGKLAHVAQVYSGLNPINLLSAIVRKTELNPDFIEKEGNTVTPPPTWLYFKDRKETYDVSLPGFAGGYLSLLSLTSSPKEILEKLKTLCEGAFCEVISSIESSFEKFTKLKDISISDLKLQPKVMFYSELIKVLSDENEEGFLDELRKHQTMLEGQIDNGELSIAEGAYKLMEESIKYCSDLSPMVVIALAPPYYPSANNSMVKRESNIGTVIEEARAYAKAKSGCNIYVQNYFTDISDLSYAMFTSDFENIDYIENNMLFWGKLYYIPLDVIKELSMPVLNVGPWGKDLHKLTERVNKKDLYENTPELMDFIIKKMLAS